MPGGFGGRGMPRDHDVLADFRPCGTKLAARECSNTLAVATVSPHPRVHQQLALLRTGVYDSPDVALVVRELLSEDRARIVWTGFIFIATAKYGPQQFQL